MDLQHFLITLLAGLAGTIAMTLIMYLYSYLLRNVRENSDTRVVHIFGTMVTNASDYTYNDYKTLIAGSAGHIGAGMAFAFSYFLLWNWGFFDIKMDDAVILGALSGILAIGVWNGYFYLHHDPPKISLLHYSIALFVAHVVFGVVTVFMFSLITDNPQFYYQIVDK